LLAKAGAFKVLQLDRLGLACKNKIRIKNCMFMLMRPNEAFVSDKLSQPGLKDRPFPRGVPPGQALPLLAMLD